MITKIEKFGASWCGPCKQMDKILEELYKEMPIEITKYDVDEYEELSEEKGIRSVPTLIFYNENGEEIKRTVGSKTLQQIIGIINDKN